MGRRGGGGVYLYQIIDLVQTGSELRAVFGDHYVEST